MSQKSFTKALLAPDLPAPDGLNDGHGAPAGKRFAVYRNNVTVSLIDALEAGFPVVAKLIGAENFRNIAREYLRTEPPASPLMMLYGKGFAAFLARFPPLAKYAYLPDIARLEYALRESYHAADHTPLAPEALGRIAPGALADVRLVLAPSLRLVVSPWPVHALWLYNKREGAPKPVAMAQSVLVARSGFDPEPHLLPQGADRFIAGLQAGKTLGDACESAPEIDLGAALGLLLGTQSISQVKHEELP
ncbi:DUF2063 domain-containing protein [Lentibacter sp. XHP0401]|uniref:HvfC/BufC N-terminal domain-containing protein n=1 Tax=Lentibacter sp. XHP0401 TaxID=2984334 RepID=UPI0021E834A7|nr:DNA-binding domain-containing protein [Lentibacter sp. XHP0401]MCV2893276.1 putative DNA-binding domain-containing protein [Lentibacter sp. XHP0401]